MYTLVDKKKEIKLIKKLRNSNETNVQRRIALDYYWRTHSLNKEEKNCQILTLSIICVQNQ